MISIPEIDNFFSKNSFTQDELDTLVNQLKVTYNKQEYIRAKQYVDLKILGFTLTRTTSSGKKEKTKKIKPKNSWHGLVKKKSRYFIKDLSITLEIPEKEIREIVFKTLNISVGTSISFVQMVKCAKLFSRSSQIHKEKLNSLNIENGRKFSVEKLAQELHWELKEFQSIIRNVTGRKFVRRLGKEDLIVLKPIIDQRRREVKSNHKKQVKKLKQNSQDKHVLKRTKQSFFDKKSQYHVYDKALEVGGVGKLIYIRSK